MTATPRPRRDWTMPALLAVVVVFVAHAVYLAVVAEDAFISFRYARHLAGGHGLVWNLGEPPVEGYSNFLWVLLCAAVIALGREVTVFAQVAGVFAGVLTIMYVWRFARRVLQLASPSALLSCGLLALSGPFATWAASGMETILFALWVTAACHHAAAYGGERRRADMNAAAAFLVLAVLTRPEGLLVAGVVFALSARWAKRGDVVVALLLFVLPVGVYVAWRVSYFGDWLPNTYYAKVGGAPLRSIRGAIYTAAFIAYYVVPVATVAALVPRVRPRNPGTVLCLSLLVVYAAYIVWAGGDYMAMYRFFAPVIPLLYLLVGRAAAIAWPRHRTATAALLLLGAAITVAHSTPVDRRVFPKPPRQHGHYGGVQTERWHSARLTLIGRYFRSQDPTGQATLATDAIGAVSYYSRLRVYGLHGLVDRNIARRRARGGGLGMPGHEKGDLLYILDKRPTFIMLSRLFTEDRVRAYPDDLDSAAADRLRRDYTPVSVWLDDRVNGESGYFTFYALRVTTRRTP